MLTEIFDQLTRRMEEALQGDNVAENVMSVFEETLDFLDTMCCKFIDAKEEALENKYKFFEAVDQLQDMYKKCDDLERRCCEKARD